MSLHRLDLCTLTVETAWRKYLEHRDTNRLLGVVALQTHFRRIDERAAAKGLAAFYMHNPLDHTAKGKVR